MVKTPLKQSIRVPNFAQKNLHARVSLRGLKLLWKREPPLKWGTDPQIFVTTKRHAKRIGGPKPAMPRGNRGRSNRKEEEEEEEDKEQEVYIKEAAASAGWTSATRLGPSPSFPIDASVQTEHL